MKKQKPKNVFFGLLLFYGLLCLLVRWFYPFIIFQPSILAASHQFRFTHRFEELNFAPEKDVKLNALWFKTTAAPSKGVVLFLHGNRDNLLRWGDEYSERFLKNNYDVLMYDYRGYGKSSGLRSEAALHADARHVYEWLKNHYAEDKIVIYGYSLGTGMATQLAAKTRPKQLILEAAYLSMPAVGWFHAPVFPYESLLSYRFHSDRCIDQVRCPVHFFHGTNDALIPQTQGLQLAAIAQKAGVKTTFTAIPNGKHKYLGASSVYQTALDNLLNQ